MASTKRFTRRTGAEVQARSPTKHAHVISNQPQPKTRSTSHSTRMKRPLSPIDSNLDLPNPKKARITVELYSRPISQAINPRKPVTIVRPQQAPSPPSPPPLKPSQPVATPWAAPKAATAPAISRHQEKVRNGIKHELDRLQPIAADANPAKDQGRKLRSQEATRFKSELSAYFPDYDEVIGNDPKEQHILNVDTPIIVIDSNPIQNTPLRQATGHADTSAPVPQGRPTAEERNSNQNQAQHISLSAIRHCPIRSYPDSLFTDLFDSQRIDFALPKSNVKDSSNDIDDPLPDSHFEPAHRRAERLEKSIRNTEKGRAQHERDQIVRLLSELQGPDWLRTMGVNGVTESRKKTFEPARDYFIKGCQAIIDKFRQWNQEEKRRKLEKERALAQEAQEAQKLEAEEKSENLEESEESEEADEAQEEQADTSDEVEEEESESAEVPDSDEEMVDAESVEDGSEELDNGDPPDSSDVDASIAKQLREEVLARAKFASSVSPTRPRREHLSASPEPEVPKEFTSFFSKKYQRDIALSKHRRSGRHVMAWGHDIPDTEENFFDLPGEYRDEETMKIRARRKRRDRRGH